MIGKLFILDALGERLGEALVQIEGDGAERKGRIRQAGMPITSQGVATSFVLRNADDELLVSGLVYAYGEDPEDSEGAKLVLSSTDCHPGDMITIPVFDFIYERGLF